MKKIEFFIIFLSIFTFGFIITSKSALATEIDQHKYKCIQVSKDHEKVKYIHGVYEKVVCGSHEKLNRQGKRSLCLIRYHDQYKLMEGVLKKKHGLEDMEFSGCIMSHIYNKIEQEYIQSLCKTEILIQILFNIIPQYCYGNDIDFCISMFEGMVLEFEKINSTIMVNSINKLIKHMKSDDFTIADLNKMIKEFIEIQN